MIRSFRLALILPIIIAIAGCGANRKNLPATTASAVSLQPPQKVESVSALCPVPAGWEPEPLKQSNQHNHQVWISPSDHTAYGVIRFSLPLPVGPELVLPFFLKEMRRTEGAATLVEKHWDKSIDGLRFVADGGFYKVRAILVTSGWQGWAIYAGTERSEPENLEELEVAERARERTVVDVK